MTVKFKFGKYTIISLYWNITGILCTY